jgi:hypothetical protein
MVYLANLDAPGLVFTYALFGVQYDTLTPSKEVTISALHSLLTQSADLVDTLQDEDHGIDKGAMRSTTFVAYWLRSQDYEKWKESAAFKDFWTSLPDDAGVWKEVMTVPKSRYMYASSQAMKAGLACMLELKQSNDEGYWGVYRHRLAGNPDDHTDPKDTFTSPYITSSKSKTSSEKSIDLAQSYAKKVVPGRVRLSNPPDNICFVREIQRKPGVATEELDAWLEQIAPHAQSWITHLDEERNKNGVVAFSTYIGHEPKESTTDEKLDTKPVAEANQLAYFLDLAHFELAGRSHRGHIELRKTVMNLYGPGGKLSAGKAVLFVELCILKSGDLDAEYIGCIEGTSLMYLRDL